MQGVVMQMITHGISTGALFIMAGMLKERLHTRDIRQMGGLWTLMPEMGGVALFFVMASLGLPVFGNFIAEFLILMGTFLVNVPLTVIATLGLVFSALYSLRLMQRVYFGPLTGIRTLSDLSGREMLIMGVLIISIIWLGLYPQPVLDLVDPVVAQLVGAQPTVAIR
jgi:NADH-quinone oxidoreductase subunit M